MDAICDDSKRLVGALMLTLFFGVLPVCLYAQSASDMKSPTTSDRTKKSSSVIRLDRVEGQTVVALADVGWPVTATGLKIVLLTSKGKLIKTVSSGEGGRFEIKDIAADEYVLKVEADEMHPLIVPVIVAKTSVVKSHSNHALQLILHLKSDAKKSVASAISNNHLRLELLDRIEKDQTVRKELIQSKDFAPNSKIGTRMSEIDAQNEARMAEVIKKHGFPSPNLVGVDGVEAASLLVQHDSLAFQKKTLPLIRNAYEGGKLPGQSFALLLDRVLIGNGDPQVYGTQAKPVSEWINQEPALSPIKDESRVDQRRKSVGLPPL